jgi:hypothetical protein
MLTKRNVGHRIKKGKELNQAFFFLRPSTVVENAPISSKYIDEKA